MDINHKKSSPEQSAISPETQASISRRNFLVMSAVLRESSATGVAYPDVVKAEISSVSEPETEPIAAAPSYSPAPASEQVTHIKQAMQAVYDIHEEKAA